MKTRTKKWTEPFQILSQDRPWLHSVPDSLLLKQNTTTKQNKTKQNPKQKQKREKKRWKKIIYELRLNLKLMEEQLHRVSLSARFSDVYYLLSLYYLNTKKSTVFVVSVYFLISFNLFSFCVSFYLHYVIHRQFLVNITISDCPLLIFLHFPFECNSMIVY